MSCILGDSDRDWLETAEPGTQLFVQPEQREDKAAEKRAENEDCSQRGHESIIDCQHEGFGWSKSSCAVSTADIVVCF